MFIVSRKYYKLFLTRLFVLVVVSGCVAGGFSQNNSRQKVAQSDDSALNDSTGLVIKGSINSIILGKSWKYQIYLPISYDHNADLKFEILYLLHGYSGNETNWVNQGGIELLLNQQIYAGKIREFIVVMPDGENDWYVDRSVKMESAIINELIPTIEKQYRFKGGRENRSIGGLSMGGYGSMRLALKYPALFSNIILMSPAAYNPSPEKWSAARISPVFQINGVYNDSIWKGLNYDNYWSVFDSSTLKPYHFYISVGSTEESAAIQSAARTQIPAALLTRSDRITVSNQIYPGGHEWSVWRAAVKDAILKIYVK